MTVNLLTLVCVISVVAAGGTGPGVPPTNRYVVRVDPDAPGRVHVEAELDLDSPLLRMTGFGAWSLTEGWGTFVTAIEGIDSAGAPVEVVPSGRNTWSVPEHLGQIRLVYDLDFRQALASPWPDGPRTIGVRAAEDGLYLFAGSLFIMGGDVDGPAEISFDLPPGWRATTPWSTSAGGTRFVADDHDELTNNAVVLGSPTVLRMPVDGDSLLVVGLDDLESAAVDIVPVTLSALSYYTGTLGSHESTNYLVVLFEDSFDSGEAFRNSFVLASTRGASSLEHRASGVAHETLHFWNGQRIRPADWSGSQWFQEGFTEYVADLFLLRQGWITQDAFLDRAEKHASFYLLFKRGSPFERISLVEAGADKATNQPALYDGGWMMAFAVDVLLRELSEGRAGVEDVLARMFEDLGPSITPYTNEDIVRYVSEAARSDQSDFFARFVFGTEVLPLRGVLARAGLRGVVRGQQVHLVPDEELPADRRCSFRTWLRGVPAC